MTKLIKLMDLSKRIIEPVMNIVALCCPLLDIGLFQGTPQSPTCCYLYLITTNPLTRVLPPSEQRSSHITLAKTRSPLQNTITQLVIGSVTNVTSSLPFQPLNVPNLPFRGITAPKYPNKSYPRLVIALSIIYK